MQGSSLELLSGYYLEHNPEALIIRGPDGSLVGVFSARGAATATFRKGADGDGAFSSGVASPALRARLLGRFELLCGDEAVSLGRNRRALSILKYLLVNRTRPVSRDHLMAWLWPDSNLEKARWSMNSAIHTLRKILDSCISPSAECVVLDEGYYSLSSEIPVSTDTDEFEASYEQGRHLEKALRIPDAAAEYEKAVGLYRGDFLIEDLYEDWTMLERERLANVYVDVLDRLASYYKETGQYQESIRTCYRILEKDRCHEDTYRRMMECYASLGLWESARRQYRLCKRVLEQEHNAAPARETQVLYDGLLADRSS